MGKRQILVLDQLSNLEDLMIIIRRPDLVRKDPKAPWPARGMAGIRRAFGALSGNTKRYPGNL